MTAAQDAIRKYPWSHEDLVRWAGFCVVGLLGIALAWFFVAGSGSFDHQVDLTPLGVGGLIVAGLGNAMWILRGRRAIGDRTERLLAATEQRLTDWLRPESSGGEIQLISSLHEELVGSEGLQYFHRASCPMAAGRTWASKEWIRNSDSGLSPCPVCKP